MIRKRNEEGGLLNLCVSNQGPTCHIVTSMSHCVLERVPPPMMNATGVTLLKCVTTGV